MSDFSIESLGESDRQNYLKFMSKIEKRGSVRTDMSPCWAHTCSKSSSGYGQIWIDGRGWDIHRYSYYIHNGCPELKRNQQVRHVCSGNFDCANPEHLIIGTAKENSEDYWNSPQARPIIVKDKRKGNYVASSGAFEKGATAGELNIKVILNWEKVREIRARHAKGLKYGELKKMSVEFGIAYITIQKIVAGTLWIEESKPVENTIINTPVDNAGVGESNNNAKLNWEKVREIRARHAKGLKYGELKKMSVEFGISYGMIQKIVAGDCWKEITD